MKLRVKMFLGVLLTACLASGQVLEWKNSLLPKEAVGKPSVNLLDAQGKPRYRIVIAKEANEFERFAAKELQDRLNSFGDWKFEIVGDDLPQNGPELRVGKTVRSGKIPDGVGFDGISIQTREDGSVEMQGGRHRGLVNAVYAFLEEDLGYRYWDKQTERKPAAPLSFIPCSRTHTPPLEWREPFMAISFQGELSLRNRTDSPNAKPPAASGGHYVMMGFAHTLPGLIPASKYFKDHPDWFQMDASGKRINWRQHCETNPQMAEELIKVLLARIEREGEPNIIHISKMDGGGTCQCAECKKVNEREGTEMGSLLTLINRVAKAIGEKYHTVRIMTFAYLETEGVPKYMRPEPNVCIQYCNTKNSWSHCLTPARQDPRVVKDVSGWAPLTPMFIWDYSTNFDHYLIPLPNLAIIQDNIRFWIANHALGLMTQGAYQGNAPGSERDRLRAWMISKLMWNPQLEWKDLMRDFATAYFGPAAEPMLSYYYLVESRNDVFKGLLDKLNIRYGFDAPFLTEDFFAAAEACFAQAHALAGDNADLRKRIERDEMPIIYARMGNMLITGHDRGDYSKLRERLKDIAAANATITIAEKAESRLTDFLKKWPKPVNKSPRQTVFNIKDHPVVRLDAIWKAKMAADGNATSAEADAKAAPLMGVDVDENGWKEYNANLGKGWKDQGIGDGNGTCVFRQHFMLNAPKECAHWYLVIPGIDDVGWISFNGKELPQQTEESTGMTPEQLWNYPYVQEVTGTLRLGFAPNVLAVRVFNQLGLGGIYAGAYLVGSDKALTPMETVLLLPDDNPYGRSSSFK